VPCQQGTDSAEPRLQVRLCPQSMCPSPVFGFYDHPETCLRSGSSLGDLPPIANRPRCDPNAASLRRTNGEYAKLSSVDEGGKRVLLIAASILAARKLANWDGRPSPVLESAIADAIAIAERIMARIDSRWPTRSTG
jgi:hypothetical protein